MIKFQVHKIYSLLFLFIIITISGFSQENMGALLKNTYSTSCEQWNDHFDESSDEIVKKDCLTKERFYAVMKLNPFDYFPKLKKYDSPLKQQIFKEDSTSIYQSYVDSLKGFKAYHKKEYEGLTYHANNLPYYDLKTKTFTIDKSVHLEYNDPEYNTIVKHLKNGNLYFNGSFFSPIPGIKQRVNGSSTLFRVITTITIENSRKALDIETNKEVYITLLFNRYRVSGKVNKAEFVAIHGNSIYKKIGGNTKINTLLNKPVTDSEVSFGTPGKALKEQLRLLSAAYNKGENSKTANSGPGRKAGGQVVGPAHGGVGDPFDIGNRVIVHAPTAVNNCDKCGTVSVLIKVNRKGYVVSAKHTDGTTSNRCLISAAIKQAKELRYAPSKSGPLFNEGVIQFKSSIR